MEIDGSDKLRLLNTVIFDSIKDRFQTNTLPVTTSTEALEKSDEEFQLVSGHYHLSIQRAHELLTRDAGKLAVSVGLEKERLVALNDGIVRLQEQSDTSYAEIFKNIIGNLPETNPNLLLLFMLKRLGLGDQETESSLMGTDYKKSMESLTPDISLIREEYIMNRILDLAFSLNFKEVPYELDQEEERPLLAQLKFFHSLEDGENYLQVLDRLLTRVNIDLVAALHTVIIKSGKREEYDNFEAEFLDIKPLNAEEIRDTRLEDSAQDRDLVDIDKRSTKADLAIEGLRRDLSVDSVWMGLLKQHHLKHPEVAAEMELMRVNDPDAEDAFWKVFKEELDGAN